jgi:Aldo/keto reductase family
MIQCVASWFRDAFDRLGSRAHKGDSTAGVKASASGTFSIGGDLPVHPPRFRRYNVVDREWEPVLDYCERERIAFIPWFPLAVGQVGKESDAARALARRHRATPAQIAIAWLLQRSPVMLPIPGDLSRRAPRGERGRSGDRVER